MKKRSELKAELKELERENHRLRDIIAVRGKHILAILESNWFGARYISARVSADGANWAVVHDHFVVDARWGSEAREKGEAIGAVRDVRDVGA